MTTVFVIDDDPGIRESLRDVLCAEGYDVDTAENGLVALERLRSAPLPDVVILDLMMPVLSGWELLEEIGSDPDLMWVPILVVSALAAPVCTAHEGGVRMSLSKPLEVDTLVEGLAALTGAKDRGGARLTVAEG